LDFLRMTGYPDRTEGGTSDHGLVARRPQTMKQPRSRVNCKKAKTVLRLPDLEHAKAAVLNSLTSADASAGIVVPSTSSLTGIALSPAWHSIGS